MSKKLISRAVLYTFIFGALFFFLNKSASDASMSHILTMTIIASLVFGFGYILLFSTLSAPAKRMKVGIVLPITVILGIIIGQVTNHMKIFVAFGFLLGLIIALIWDFLSNNHKGESQ